MKVFAIWDDDWENKTPIGYLFCYEKENAFMIELNSELDEWNAPLLFSSFVKKKYLYDSKRDKRSLGEGTGDSKRQTKYWFHTEKS